MATVTPAKSSERGPDLEDPMFQQLAEIMEASGLTINGDKEFDPKIHHPDLAKRVFSEGMIAMGESYMDGWWDCDAMDEMVTRAMVCLLYTSPSPRD